MDNEGITHYGVPLERVYFGVCNYKLGQRLGSKLYAYYLSAHLFGLYNLF